jgi:hypothetical protein
MLGGLLLLLLAVGIAYGWRTWGRDALARADQRLTVENLQITPQPEWIERNVAAEVFRDASLGRLSLLDSELTPKVHHAFEMHPWVAEVPRVGKRPGGTILVELRYRRPVAWVEIPDELTAFEGKGLFPIDRDAVLLPKEEFETRVDRFPLIRIAVPNPEPWGLEGQPWDDARIEGAAKIADALHDCWRELKLYLIRAKSVGTDRSAGNRATVYEIVTEDTTTFVWGSAPGHEQPGELTAFDKIERMRRALQNRYSMQLSPIDLRAAHVPAGSRR